VNRGSTRAVGESARQAGRLYREEEGEGVSYELGFERVARFVRDGVSGM
jgi:hypothetical protein